MYITSFFFTWRDTHHFVLVSSTLCHRGGSPFQATFAAAKSLLAETEDIRCHSIKFVLGFPFLPPNVAVNRWEKNRDRRL